MKLLWKKNKGILSFLFPRKLKVEVVHDVVDSCRKNKIYIIKDSYHKPWLIQFQCPCGCHSIINLNLLIDANPCWRYFIDKEKRITIKPSVHRLVGCHSHFNIIKGKVIWVGEERYLY